MLGSKAYVGEEWHVSPSKTLTHFYFMMQSTL